MSIMTALEALRELVAAQDEHKRAVLNVEAMRVMGTLARQEKALAAARAVLAQPVVQPEPPSAPAKTYYFAKVTDCEACLTPDACAIRGQCAFYLREE